MQALVMLQGLKAELWNAACSGRSRHPRQRCALHSNFCCLPRCAGAYIQSGTCTGAPGARAPLHVSARLSMPHQYLMLQELNVAAHIENAWYQIRSGGHHLRMANRTELNAALLLSCGTLHWYEAALWF